MADDERRGRAENAAMSGRSAALTDNGRALRWRCVGPHRGGRVVAVAGHPSDSMTFYFGACAGGLWKTCDGGMYWENVSDRFFHTAAVGAVAVAPSDPNVIYAGMGEATIRGDVSHGDGVYRSTDAGKTWSHLGLGDSRHIAKICVHPQNPDLVYVAVLGHAWGPNSERGLYRSKDGGVKWEQILYRNEETGAIDLSIDPTNPRILFASLWQARRSPYSLSSGGPGSGIFRSTDGGDTWEELTHRPGLPSGVKGKIGLAVSAAGAERVWALVEAEDGALFRSDDGGENWQRLSEDAELRKRAWYYMHLYADPRDAETLWVLNLQCWKSIDGGRTFAAIPTPHGDNHDLWIDPINPLRMIEGNDGGACVSFNGGLSWSTLYNQPTAQMYHVTVDSREPYHIYGSQQDNSAIALAGFSSRGAITPQDWFEPGGGESGYIAVRPDNSDIVIGGGIGSGPFNGRLVHYDRKTGQERDITVWPSDQGMGDGANTLKYRFQWTFPVFFSPHNPNVLYVAANKLLRSRDEGTSWQEVSPDLTRNDPATQQASGGPITKDNTGAEVYGTIFACVESPHEEGVLWAGSDDGLLHVSRDEGATWTNVTPTELPEWSLITNIEVSPFDANTVYMCATRYKHDDTRPYLYKTKDGGITWQLITSGIPENEFTRVIRADPGCRNLLFAGTETGIYVSFDDGSSWSRMHGNLPTVPIYDLIVHDTDLIAATHGRSFWVLDDVTPLRELRAEEIEGRTRLFAPRPARRMKVYQGWGYKPSEAVNYRHVGTLVAAYRSRKKPDGTMEEDWLDAGKNPPIGAVVTYFLPEKPTGEVTLTFLDGSGQEIRRFSSTRSAREGSDDGESHASSSAGSPGEGMESVEHSSEEDETVPLVPAEAGLNRFVWDMRYPEARKLPGEKNIESTAGPVAVPGKYAVRLAIGVEALEAPLEIVNDPRVDVPIEHLRKQFALAIDIRDKLTETHEAVISIRDLLRQVESWQNRLSTRPSDDAARQAVDRLKQTLLQMEDQLAQRNADTPLNPPSRPNFQLAALLEAIQTADTAPTQGQYGVFEELKGRVDPVLQQYRDVVARDLAEVNAEIVRSGVPPLVPPAGRPSQSR